MPALLVVVLATPGKARADVPPVLLEPADEQVVAVEDLDELDFSVLAESDGSIRVQFASDDEFSGGSLECDTGWVFSGFSGQMNWTYPGPVSDGDVECPLDPGAHYWRVQWDDGETFPWSEVRSFTIVGQTCDEVAVESSQSAAEVVFDFGENEYGCGQFANGDWFVVPPTPEGDVTIDAISPAMITGHHGVDVNPSVTSGNTQSWDDRQPGYAAPTISFPYDAEAGESIVKYVSNDTGETDCLGFDGDSCGQFVAVLTVLEEAPEEPAETFRPPYFGTYKPLLSTDELQTDNLLRLDDACCTTSRIDDAFERTRHVRFDHSPSSTSELEPNDALPPDGLLWGGDVLKNDTEIVNWLLLENACDDPPCTQQEDLEAKLPVLIGYVQYGIDLWGATRAGTSLLKGGGGNGAGKLFTEVFAATMLANEEMQDDIGEADERDFWESFSYYRGSTGLALWGQLYLNDNFTQWETAYWDELDNGDGSIRDPYGLIDGGSTPGESYQKSTMMPTKYTALILQLIPDMHDYWPGSHEDVIMEYAERAVEIGAWAQPDTCAPKSGTYGTDYGPNGSSGCIADASGPPFGRLPASHGNTQDGTGASRQSAFGNDMWDEYWEDLS